MAQLRLKGVYWDDGSQAFWSLNDSGSYVQVGGGSGSTPTLDEVLAAGSTLTENRGIDIANNRFMFSNGNVSINGEPVNAGFNFTVWGDNPSNPLIQTKKDNTNIHVGANIGDGTTSDFYLNAEEGDVGFLIYSQDISKPTRVQITGSGTLEEITYEATNHVFNGRTVGTTNIADDFPDDAAAAVGGIAVGGNYHTSGACKIRLA